MRLLFPQVAAPSANDRCQRRWSTWPHRHLFIIICRRSLRAYCENRRDRSKQGPRGQLQTHAYLSTLRSKIPL